MKIYSDMNEINSIDNLWHKIIHVPSTLRQNYNGNFYGEKYWNSFKPSKKLVKSFKNQADIIDKERNLIKHIHFCKTTTKKYHTKTKVFVVLFVLCNLI